MCNRHGRALVLRGDARHLPLPDASVDLIVTSPPYYALRSYTDGGQHYPGQIGSEATPTEYLAALLDCTREWARVLKPSGSIWVDLGDKYSSPGGHTDNNASTRLQGRPNLRKQGRADRSTSTHGIPIKSLMLLPERYRIACVDELGLTARAVVVWSKPNGLPESVTDRVRRSHEDWVHLVKQPRYYSAVDEIRQPYAPKTFTVNTTPRRSDDGSAGDRRNRWHTENAVQRSDMIHPFGALPGSVWEIATEPLSVPVHLEVDHFAAFPTEWPRRIILGWSPGGGLILDPFGGTGTTALVAAALGRTGITVDRSGDYCRLAAWRTSDPREIAKAMRVERPKPVAEDQLTFELGIGG